MTLWRPQLPAGLWRLIRGRRDKTQQAVRRPLLAPRWLVSVDAGFNLQAYRLCLHWNGRRALAPGTLPAGEPCYLVLHPGLPFRRKLQRFPTQSKAREVLLRAAPDEFPLTDGVVTYCLGLRQNEGYVYALPGAFDDQLRERGLLPDIVLVGNSDALDEAVCLSSLEAYETYGATLAFGSRRRPLSRRWLLDLPLAASAALALALVTWLTLGADPFAELLQGEHQRLQKETAVVAGQYAATESMLAARSQLARLREDPDAQLAAELAKLWDNVPPGHAIRRIEFKEGRLTVTGSGANANQWLESSGFSPAQITTETTGKLSRFRAEKTLGR